MKKIWLIVVNPNAGNGQAKNDWSEIKNLLDSAGIKFHSVFTEARGHATDLTSKYIEQGYNKVLVVGGGGTLNEVINGIFVQQFIPTTEIVVGMIPVGIGNDWAKMADIPVNYSDAVKIIAHENVIMQDVGKVKYFNADKQRSRYFMNIAGMGFDAQVLKRSNIKKEKRKMGKLVYLMNLFMCLFNFKYINSTITIDKTVFTDNIFSMNVAIGKYSGGGMLLAPQAIVDDGLFDVTVISEIRKFDIVRNISRIYDGSIIDHPKVNSYRGETIKVDSTEQLKLEVDGESLGHAPFVFEIFKKAIGIVVGQEVYFKSSFKPIMVNPV